MRIGTDRSLAARTTSRTLSRVPIVPGLSREAVGPRFQASHGQAVVEMDIGDQRNRRRFPEAGEGPGGLRVGDRQPDDLASLPGEAADFSGRRPDVAGVGLGHGLNADRRSSPDSYVSDPDLNRPAAGE